MEIRPQTQVAEVASAHPETIRVFQRHGVDFCCGGKRPLSEACAESGVAFETLQVELQDAVNAAPPAQRSWQDASLTELVDHIVDRYHGWLKEELPRLTSMMKKVIAVHGERHAELSEIGGTFQEILDEIGPHMMREERVLFPYVSRMDGLRTQGEALATSPFGSVRNPIGAMEYEHEAVGQLLVTLRRQTRGYVPPEDACNTYRGLFHGLSELERELHEHIHLENNVLHPRAIAVEQQLQAVGV